MVRAELLALWLDGDDSDLRLEGAGCHRYAREHSAATHGHEDGVELRQVLLRVRG